MCALFGFGENYAAVTEDMFMSQARSRSFKPCQGTPEVSSYFVCVSNNSLCESLAGTMLPAVLVVKYCLLSTIRLWGVFCPRFPDVPVCAVPCNVNTWPTRVVESSSRVPMQ